MISSKYKHIILAIFFIIFCIFVALAVWYYSHANKLTKLFADFTLKPVAMYVQQNDQNHDELYIEFISNIQLNHSEKIFFDLSCIADKRQQNIDIMQADFRSLDGVIYTDVNIYEEKVKQNEFYYQAKLILPAAGRLDIYNNTILCKAKFATLMGKNFYSNVIKFDTSKLRVKK